ncbi:unnamed protein product [Durusdinium trenchii]|uniref:Polycystin cation channel PKD1/PKD2 domain-containing protein n=2 Tax=Durusdinium trenchii TaxID=1381693 RepID=A0ABP0JGC1_9DINO
MTVTHRVFYWVETTSGLEFQRIEPEEVARHHGVPAKELFTYWQREIDCDEAVRTLPRTLFMILFFALMLFSHEMIGNTHSLERAIRWDIEENANFAVNSVGTFAHKNLYDVNSFADFYSWFRLGFAAIYMPQSSSVSEGSSLSTAALSAREKQVYRDVNRKLGPVKLSQQTAKATACDNFDLLQAIDNTTTSDSCSELGKDFTIQPTDFDVGFLDFIEDSNKTRWFSFLDDPSDKITQLERSNWLSAQTDHWKISMVLYNPDFDILTLTDIHFLLARSGRIWKQITLMSLKMRPYANLWLLCWEILFFLSILSILAEEVHQIITGLMSERERRCVRFFLKYIRVWTLIDWASIIIAFTLLGLWVHTVQERHALQVSLQTLLIPCNSGNQAQCQGYQDDVVRMATAAGSLAEQTTLVSSFYPFCILLRLFKTFTLQPRLAVVSRTIWAAFVDLVHFGIIFVSVFLSFVFMAMGFFGRAIEGYSSLNNAFITLFRALMGDLDFEAMEAQAGRFIAGLFHLSFMVTMVLILLNMLIAIIMDVHAESKQSAASGATVWEDVADYFNRLWQRRAGTRMSILKAKALFTASAKQEAKNTGSAKSTDEREVITVAELRKRVPEMPMHQATESIEQSVVWFERLNSEEAQLEVLRELRQLRLQVAAGSEKSQAREEELCSISVETTAMDLHQKAHELAEAMNEMRHSMEVLQKRLEHFEKPSRRASHALVSWRTDEETCPVDTMRFKELHDEDAPQRAAGSKVPCSSSSCLWDAKQPMAMADDAMLVCQGRMDELRGVSRRCERANSSISRAARPASDQRPDQTSSSDLFARPLPTSPSGSKGRRYPRSSAELRGRDPPRSSVSSAPMTTIAHKVYYWVETTIENEYKIFQPKDIAYRHGVPAKELFTYWQKEIDCDKAVQTLPRTLFLIIFFALMLLSHEMIGPAQSIERAIRFDIEENANFAFNGVGTFGNKNIQDVNSFADFYSWFRLGFAAIYMPQSTSVSEGSTLTAVPLSTPNKQIYLETNRKLGPIKLSQQKVTKASQCDNYNLFQAIDAGVTADSCAALGKDFFIQPTDFDIGFLDFTEDMNATIWFSPMEDATPLITWLENSTWLTSDTDHWKITMVLYNPDFDILTVTGIHFLLARSGRIWKQITFMSLKMAPYANLWPLCWEILFFGSIFTIFIEEVYEVVSGLLATRVRGRCKCVSFFREYISVWNLIDWVSIILAFTLLGMWILTCEDRKALQVAVEALIATCSSADQNTCQEYQEYVLDLASDAGQLAGQTSLVSSFYPFCILLRLFKTFSLQPRLAVVTRTLWASFADLAHFGIIFLSVFVTFVFMAMGFFGRTVEGYSSFHIAFVTLFRALMGDLDFDAMEEQAGRVIAGIFHLAFMLTMLLILLNMLIAIIMDVYAETKRNVPD